MRILLVFMFCGAAALAQSAAQFPGAVPAPNYFGVASNSAETTLAIGMASTDTTITVLSSAGFKVGGYASIDSEIVAICAIPDGTHLKVGFSDCPNVDGRGTDMANGGGAAASHLPTAKVQGRIVAANVNQAAAEVIAITGKLHAEMVSVKDFGAKGDGVTDDTEAVQAALAASLQVFVPPGKYLVTSPIRLRSNQHIVCANSQGTFAGPTGAVATGTQIYAKHTGNAILDLTGQGGDLVEGCTLVGDAGTTPKSGIYLTRVGTASAGEHTFRDLTVTGSFSATGVYIVTSENNSWENLRVDIRGGGATYAIYGSPANDLGFLPTSTEGGSTEANYFRNLTALNYNTGGAAVIYINCLNNLLYGWTFDGANLAAYGGAYVSIQVTGQSQTRGPIEFRNIVGEPTPGGDVNYGFLLTEYPGNSGWTLEGLRIHGAYLEATGYFFEDNSAACKLILDSADISVGPQPASSLIGPQTNSKIYIGNAAERESLLFTPGNTYNVGDGTVTDDPNTIFASRFSGNNAQALNVPVVEAFGRGQPYGLGLGSTDLVLYAGVGGGISFLAGGVTGTSLARIDSASGSLTVSGAMSAPSISVANPSTTVPMKVAAPAHNNTACAANAYAADSTYFYYCASSGAWVRTAWTAGAW